MESAAQHLLKALPALAGLDLDAQRITALRPLTRSLLEMGERLTQAIEPTVEPACTFTAIRPSQPSRSAASRLDR